MNKWLVLCSLALLFALQTSTVSAKKENDELQVMLGLARYTSKILSKVQAHWNPKLSLMESRKHSATVTLWIHPQGKLTKLKLLNHTQNKEFNQSLLAALRKSQPFEPPSALLHKMLETTGIEIFFRKQVFKKTLLPLQPNYKGTAVLTPLKSKKQDKK